MEVNTSQSIVPSLINTKLNELSQDCNEEIVHNVEVTSEKNENTHSTTDINKSLADVKKEKKFRRKAKHKKSSGQTKVYVVYKLPSGRKVMFYHLPILNK